jgi:hypothetical protein
MVSASAAFIAFAYPGPHQLCATAHGRPLRHSPQWLTPPFCTSPLHSHFQPFYHHIGNCIKVSPKGRIICRRQVANAFTAANCSISFACIMSEAVINCRIVVRSRKRITSAGKQNMICGRTGGDGQDHVGMLRPCSCGPSALSTSGGGMKLQHRQHFVMQIRVRNKYRRFVWDRIVMVLSRPLCRSR